LNNNKADRKCHPGKNSRKRFGIRQRGKHNNVEGVGDTKMTSIVYGVHHLGPANTNWGSHEAGAAE